MIHKILPDIFSVVGTSMIGYGLWIYDPSVSLTIVGTIILAAGLKLGANEAQK